MEERAKTPAAIVCDTTNEGIGLSIYVKRGSHVGGKKETSL